MIDIIIIFISLCALVSLNFLSVTPILNKPKKSKRKRRTKKVKDEAAMTQYTNIGGLLADLDSVFKDLKIMKSKNSATQAGLKKFGTYLCSMEDPEDYVHLSELEAHKAYGFPSFLSNYMRTTDEDKVDIFSTAQKLDKLKTIKKKKGCVYYDVSFSTVLDGHPYTLNAGVEVNKETGKILALPELTTKFISQPDINPKYSKAYIPVRGWEYPDISDKPDQSEKQKREYIQNSFALAYNITMRREYGISIIIRKGNQRVTFTVPQDEWKYFFKERTAVVINGVKKRIFHSVSSHQRVTDNGVQNVKTHYRGLRKFRWNGYNINIIMQGKHGVSQAGFNCEAITEPQAGEKYLNTKDTAKLIKNLEENYEPA